MKNGRIPTQNLPRPPPLRRTSSLPQPLRLATAQLETPNLLCKILYYQLMIVLISIPCRRSSGGSPTKARRTNRDPFTKDALLLKISLLVHCSRALCLALSQMMLLTIALLGLLPAAPSFMTPCKKRTNLQRGIRGLQPKFPSLPPRLLHLRASN